MFCEIYNIQIALDAVFYSADFSTKPYDRYAEDRLARYKHEDARMRLYNNCLAMALSTLLALLFAHTLFTVK